MKKVLFLVTLAVSLLLCGNALAADDLNYTLTIEQSSRMVAVDANIDGNTGDTAVTGLVVNSEDTVVYAAQGYTDKDGNFSFSYINNDNDGSYTLTVKAPRKGLTTGGSFKILTNSMRTAISQTTKDSAGMKSIIESYGDYMNLDMTEFNKLTDSDSVYDFMAKDAYVNLNDVSTVIDGFYGAVIVKTLAENKSSTDYIDFLNNSIYDILSKRVIPLGTKTNLFDELSADVKAGVLSKVVGYNYTSAGELTDKLSFFVLEQSLAKALQWTEVNPIMKKYSDAGLLNVDFTAYNALNQKEAVDNQMIKDFDSYDAIKSTFDAAVTTQAAAEAGSNNPPTITTRPGGGGGGGGGSPVIPSVKVPEAVEKPNQSTVTVVFNDMEDYKWANEAVTYLAEKGIISGTGDGMFEPAKGLTREEISTILVKTLKLSCEGKESSFVDVPKEKWSYPYVSAVFNEGLMVGISDDTFGATSLITRNEFAVIMKRLVDLYAVELDFNTTAGEYDDAAQIPGWAKESVDYLKGTALMLGNTGSTFAGDEIVSRAYACDVLYTVLKAIKYDAEV